VAVQVIEDEVRHHFHPDHEAVLINVELRRVGVGGDAFGFVA
jgi:hypothetical protein